MRSFPFLILLVGLLFLASCSKNDDNAPDPAPGQVTAVLNGADFFSNISLTGATLTNIIDKTLTIGATEQVEAGETAGILSLALIVENGDTSGCVPTGDYAIDSGAPLRVVPSYEIGSDFYGLTGVGVRFEARVTDCDVGAGTISGTFSGVLEGTNGETLTIENGRFNQIPISR